MDNELRGMIADEFFDSRILRALIDTILDTAELDYTGEDLTIKNDKRLLAVVRAFYDEEYIYRLNQLKTRKFAEDLGAKIEEG